MSCEAVLMTALVWWFGVSDTGIPYTRIFPFNEALSVLTDVRNTFSFDTIDAQMIISGSIDEKESLKEENVQESSA